MTATQSLSTCITYIHFQTTSFNDDLHNNILEIEDKNVRIKKHTVK